VKRSSTLLCVFGVAVFKGMSTYMTHEKTTSAKRNRRKKSTLTERERLLYIENHNYCSTVTAELNIIEY
jgi:hypothetical protein